jgi:FkbM family methyltransferase
MIRALKKLRLLFPPRARRRLRMLLFEWLGLDWQMPTGIRIHLAAYGDWVVYNEIFVSGEYDQALAMAFGRPAGPAGKRHVVDLGANTGFFTLRAAHEARLRGIGPRDLEIVAVEGDRYCAGRCRDVIAAQPDLADRVRVVHALVGERTGTALLQTDNTRISTSLYRRDDAADPARYGPAAEPVPYVDLSALLAPIDCIDLLKCDIEGAEQRFIENYPDVLAKVRLAVFEFHRDLCDVDRCQALLRQYGFTHAAIFRPGEVYFIYGVWR